MRQPVQWRRCKYSSNGIRCLSCSKSSRMGAVPFCAEHRRELSAFPGKDGGWKRFFKSAGAKPAEATGRPWARTVAHDRGGVTKGTERHACGFHAATK